MSAINSASAKSSQLHLKSLLRLIAGAVLGAVVGGGLVKLLKMTGLSVKSMTFVDLFPPIVIGMGFIVMGTSIALLATNRKRLAAQLERSSSDGTFDEEKIPATDSEVRMAIVQAAVLALAGVLMLAPVFATGPVHAHPGIAAAIYIGIIALFLVQTALSIRLWRESDEFLRKSILAVCAGTFAVSQALLFLWAAAEKLSLVPAASSWQIFNILMVCYMAVNIYALIRMRR